MAYAPQAIQDAYAYFKANAPKSWNVRLGGIVGDAAHSFGYHLAPNQLPSSDYSRQLSADRGSLVDSNAASALDVTMSDAGMKAATRNLIRSAEDPNDPRMLAVREFMGTLNGSRTVGRSQDGDYEWYQIADWDSSHLWHVHISFLRKYAKSKKQLVDVMSAMLGLPYKEGPPVANPVWSAQDIKNPSWRADAKTNPMIKASSALYLALDEAHDAKVLAEAANKKLDAILAELKK